jgi:dienelactone hydrolase
VRAATSTIAFLFGLLFGHANAGQLIAVDGGPGEGKGRRLMGYIARPASAGPHPAVVILHSCGGFSNHTIAWADAVGRMGYVALAIDSFGPRGIVERCSMGFQDQALDAWRARDFLARQSYVDGDRIGVLGFSMGGISALAVMQRGLIEQLHPAKFKAAAALYPRCTEYSGDMVGPTLILIGEKDDWTPAQECRDMVAGRSGTGVTRPVADRSLVRLVVYPGAYHSFDLPDLRFVDGFRAFGHWLAYDDAATDSFKQVREFFRQTIPPAPTR